MSNGKMWKGWDVRSIRMLEVRWRKDEGAFDQGKIEVRSFRGNKGGVAGGGKMPYIENTPGRDVGRNSGEVFQARKEGGRECGLTAK